MLDLRIQVLDLHVALLQLIVAVDDEVGRDALDVIAYERLRVASFWIPYTDPRQRFRLSLEEMLVGIVADLVDFEALGMILVIQLSQDHDALC